MGPNNKTAFSPTLEITFYQTPENYLFSTKENLWRKKINLNSNGQPKTRHCGERVNKKTSCYGDKNKLQLTTMLPILNYAQRETWSEKVKQEGHNRKGIIGKYFQI